MNDHGTEKPHVREEEEKPSRYRKVQASGNRSAQQENEEGEEMKEERKTFNNQISLLGSL